MKIVLFTICVVCSNPAPVIEDSRYAGLRGICFECKGNWPES